MLLYLLNATIVWGSFLLFFRLFLESQTSHAYNRAYLLISMLLGLILPALRWEKQTTVTDTVLYTPIQRTAAVSSDINMVSQTVAAEHPVSISLLSMLYALVIVASVALFVKEVFQLIRLYRRGKKTYEGSFAIVETGKEHSPFSIFKLIFVQDKAQYTETQWRFLMAHEQKHAQLWHSIDKLVLLLLRCAFWFHPLVHVYYRKLVLVHEYQADSAIKGRLEAYGEFLLEQTLLARPGILVHAFNYSPIKKRMFMLTRKDQSKRKLARYMLVVPLVVAVTLFCTQNVFSSEPARGGNTMSFHGNEVEFAARNFDINAISLIPYPVKVNGKQILDAQDESLTQKLRSENGNFEELLVNGMKEELSKLPDADNYMLNIRDIVIDENGKVAYYYIEKLRQFFPPAPDPNMPRNAQSPLALQFMPEVRAPGYEVIRHEITNAQIEAINNKLEAALAKVQFRPAVKDGRNVPVLTRTQIGIEVKNGKVSFRAGGC